MADGICQTNSADGKACCCTCYDVQMSNGVAEQPIKEPRKEASRNPDSASAHPQQHPINLNSAVLALCSLALFSLFQDDLEGEWKSLTSSSVTSISLLSAMGDHARRDSMSAIIFAVLVIVSIVATSVATTRKWRSISTARSRVQRMQQETMMAYPEHFSVHINAAERLV